MAAVYRSICFEADTLLLEISRLSEEQITLKVIVEKLMTDSFVDLAKARYIMGSGCVSKLQLPTEFSNKIQPVATVTRENVDNYVVFKINRADETNLKTQSSNTVRNSVKNIGSETSSENYGECEELVESERAFKTALQENPSSLKRSKYAYCVEDKLFAEFNDELLDEMSTDTDSSSVSVVDPIRLFGVLVPNALKQAQVGFKKVIEVVAHCATVQHHLREVLYKYNHLIRVKNLIESVASVTKVNIIVPRVYWTPSEVSSYSSISLKTVVESQEEEETESSKLSVQKSIRSVLFDAKAEGEADLELWSQDSEMET